MESVQSKEQQQLIELKTEIALLARKFRFIAKNSVATQYTDRTFSEGKQEAYTLSAESLERMLKRYTD